MISIVRRFGAWLIRPLPAHHAHLAGTVLTFFVGSLLSFTFLLSDADWQAPAAGAFIVTYAFVISRSNVSRWVRVIALLLVCAAYALWTYEFVAFGEALDWTMHPLIQLLAYVLVIGVLLTHRPQWKRAEIPLVLPMGVVIAACLWGWRAEEARIRCVDWRAVIKQKDVHIRVPTLEKMCSGDELVPIGRFPRHLSESPDGKSYVFTTQLRNPNLDNSIQVAGRFSGSICTVPADASSPPTCTGAGTAQGMAESETLDRFFVANWGPVRQGGKRGGRIYAIARNHPLRVIDEREVTILSGELFYDPAGDLLGVFSDEAEFMYPFRASTLEPLDPIPAPIIPGDTHFDAQQREGVSCFAAGPIKTLNGKAFGAVAMAVDPFRVRPLAPSSSAPWMYLAFSWGCDWDPAQRRVYAAIASLGLLHEIDYDSGAIVRTFFTGLGVRSVAYDKKRQRLYLGHYLTGRVRALDLESGRILKKWTAGRFLRTIVLSRDERRLLVTSNLGIVEIDLGD